MKKIQILGTGCAKCEQLYEQAKRAVDELATAGQDCECELEKVTDINEIVSFGVMMTPALAVDGEVKAAGRVPAVEEIKTLIQ